MTRTPSPTALVEVVNPRRGGLPGAILRGFVASLILAVLLVGLAGFWTYAFFARDLPRLDTFDRLERSTVSRFMAADGTLVGEWSDERRLALRWEEVPSDLVLAFLAAEDARFFAHTGIDLVGIFRAMVTNLRAGGIKEGASTITQQLAKTLVGDEKSLTRKAREAILARRMEDLYTKKQILSWYLNAIFLGHGSYGVQAASQNYFRKNVWQLELAEMAMIAGLPQSPSRVNPVVDMPAAKKRMAHILGNMRQRGWITEEEEAEALAYEFTIYPRADLLGDHVPFYTETVRRQVVQTFDGATRGGPSWLEQGLTVHMAVEPALQRVAEQALRGTLEGLAKKQGYPGPLGTMGRDKFFVRNQPWVSQTRIEPGVRLLGRVAEVDGKQAKVELSPHVRGTLTSKGASWAGKYSEYPVDDKTGERKIRGSVSFWAKLGSMEKTFAPGDVVLVEITKVPGLRAEDGKKKTKAKKKKGEDEGTEEPAAEETAEAKDPSPEALTQLEFELVPVPLMEGAVVSFPTHSGGMDVMVGGWDFDRSQVNRVYALRQTGSTMKPIVYAKAYDMGLPPSTVFSGAPFHYDDGHTQYNPTGARVVPDMSAWDALTKSENSVSLRVFEWVLRNTSLADYKAWGQRLGLTHPLQGNISEVLGGDQTPFGMAHAFGVFARRGYGPRMHTVRKVVDRAGNVLHRNIGPLDPYATFPEAIVALWETNLRPEQPRINPSTAFLATANLAEAVQRGTGTRAKAVDHQAAGKTGTLPFDVWFNGWTWHRHTLVWVGADRRERVLGRSYEVNKVYGGDTALPAWVEFMKQVDVGRAKRALLERPPGEVNYTRIDPATGLRAVGGGAMIPHRAGTEPSEYNYPDEQGASEILQVEHEF